MKFLYLSRLTIKFHAIVAVEWDLLMVDGCKTTVIHHNIPGLPVFQLYSGDSKYEEDKVQLISALNEKATIPTRVCAQEKGTSLEVLNLSARIYNSCYRAEINYVEELDALNDRELLRIKGLNTISIKEIKEKLEVWHTTGKS